MTSSFSNFNLGTALNVVGFFSLCWLLYVFFFFKWRLVKVHFL